MTRFAIVFVVAGLAACDTTVRREEMASVDYGAKPTRWREEIRSYLDIRLANPKEALVEFRSGEPKQLFQRDSVLREQQHGWATCVWVNDKKEGKFEGFYPITFFFRGDKIVAVNNGPDDSSLIGSRLAREQCARLMGG
jgi:hypothetical protein